MPCLILLAVAAVTVPVAPSLNETRTVIEAQLASPPRAGRLSPAEAAVIEERYLQSIGKRIERDKSTGGNAGQ